MPLAPDRVCSRCGRPTPARKPCQCRPAWEGSTNTGHGDSRMRRALDAYRRDHPLCQHPGCPRLADQVDHIVPLAELDERDTRRYSSDNLQSLCLDHHTAKTVIDARRGKTRLRGE